LISAPYPFFSFFGQMTFFLRYDPLTWQKTSFFFDVAPMALRTVPAFFRPDQGFFRFSKNPYGIPLPVLFALLFFRSFFGFATLLLPTHLKRRPFRPYWNVFALSHSGPPPPLHCFVFGAFPQISLWSTFESCSDAYYLRCPTSSPPHW